MSTPEQLEKRRVEIIRLMHELGYDDFDEYQLIQKIAYQMRFYKIGEEEALDLIQNYYMDVKIVKEQQAAETVNIPIQPPGWGDL